MHPRTVIKTSFPTVHETAKKLGMSASRVRQIEKLMNEIIGTKGTFEHKYRVPLGKTYSVGRRRKGRKRKAVVTKKKK